MKMKNITDKLRLRYYQMRSLFVKRDKNIWVFGAWLGDKYRDNSMEFYEWMIAHCPEISCYWFTRNDVIYEYLHTTQKQVVNSETEHKKAKAILKKAGYIVCCVSPLDITTRTEYFYGASIVNLWHGIPIKGLGISKKRDGWLKERMKSALGFERYYFSTAASEKLLHITRLYLPANCIMPILGYPNHDALLSRRVPHVIDDIIENFPNATKILYMPTFRQSMDNGNPFRPFDFEGFNIEKFSKILEKENIVFLNKGHYWDKKLTNNKLSDRIIDIEDTPLLNNMDLLRQADILITDYSSIFYDFLFLGKPIIKAPFDIEDYMQDRGLLIDYDQLPGTRVNNWDELCSCLENHTYAKIDNSVIKRYFKYHDANASKRIFDYIKTHS